MLLYNGIPIFKGFPIYVCSSWLLSFFAPIFAFGLVYITPFLIGVDLKHDLGKAYCGAFLSFTLTNLLLMANAPSWAFFLLILLTLGCIHTYFSKSDYINSLTTLKSLPLKTQYKKIILKFLKLSLFICASFVCVFMVKLAKLMFTFNVYLLIYG